MNHLNESRFLRIIVLFVIVSRLLLMFRPEERIYTRPYLEDSFYLFNCAEHLAHGEGFTCDGKQPTNGVQPLIVVLYAPLFLIAGTDKLLALKLAFILIAIFDSLSVVLIAYLIRILQKNPNPHLPAWKSPPIIGAFLWATLYPIFVHTGSGLETGIYSVMLLASLFYYAKIFRFRNEGNKVQIIEWVIFGIILGFTVLARVDAVFLVIAFTCYELFKYKRKGFISAAIISVTAFIISSPWWIYNYKVFGRLMPQSGISESLESGILLENLRRAAIVLGDILTVFFFLPNYELPVWFHFLWLFVITALVTWIVYKYGLGRYLKNSIEFSSIIPFLLFCGSLVIYYVFFFAAPHFIPRYFQPFRIIWLILFACIAPELFTIFKEYYMRYKNKVLIFAWVFLLSSSGFSFSSYIYYFVIEKKSDFYLMGKFALQHPTDKIGMQQSGTAGFIASNVVNLDGKVNYNALKALIKNDIGKYIETEKLDYIGDWREFSEQMVASAEKHGGRFREVDSIGRVIIFKRVSGNQ